MIWTCPLMGRTYSRLGATFGSPKLRLLSSFVSFVSFSPPPLCTLPVARQAIYQTTSLSLRVAVCRAPFQLLGSLILHLNRPSLCSLNPQGVAPFPINDLAAPFHLRFNNVFDSRCTLTRSFYLGGDNRDMKIGLLITRPRSWQQRIRLVTL